MKRRYWTNIAVREEVYERIQAFKQRYNFPTVSDAILAAIIAYERMKGEEK